MARLESDQVDPGTQAAGVDRGALAAWLADSIRA